MYTMLIVQRHQLMLSKYHRDNSGDNAYIARDIFNMAAQYITRIGDDAGTVMVPAVK